jgi:transcriptional regulator with XRE-family HTH domain
VRGFGPVTLARSMASTSAVLFVGAPLARSLLTSPGERPGNHPLPLSEAVPRASLIRPLESRSHSYRHLPMAFAIGTVHGGLQLRRDDCAIAVRGLARYPSIPVTLGDWPGHSVASGVIDFGGHIACPLCGRVCLVYVHPVASANGDAERPIPARQARGRRQPGPVDDANPTVRQRELGIRLRELRTGLGLTVEQVGAELLCSATKISRLETGARRASLRDVRDLCQVYGVADPAPLMELARQAREPGWWSRFDDLGAGSSPFIGLEQEAVAITSYSMYYVPPLLQTAEYARTVIRGIDRKMETRILGNRVEARLLRQRRLDSPSPPRYRALTDEAVFRRPVGGLAVMRSQLDKILTWAALDRGSIQVIPFSAGAHASADSNFDLLEFGENSSQVPIVHVEGLVTTQIHERPGEVARYREAIEYLRDSALNPADSAALIAAIRDDYSS